MAVRIQLNPTISEAELILQGLRMIQDELQGTQQLNYREEQELESLISEIIQELE